MNHDSQKTLHHLLQTGFRQHKAGELAAAERCYRQVLRLQPHQADALYLLGLLAYQTGQHDRAVSLIEQALHRAPGSPDAHLHLGMAYRAMHRMDRAEACFRQALALVPSHSLAWNQMALLHKDRCQQTEALAAFEHSMAGQPGNVQAFRNKLLFLQYLPELDEETRFAEHRRFATTFSGQVAETVQPFVNTVAPHRPLRVGYVSSDLCDHVIAFHMLPILENHDRRQFEMYAYADVPKPDPITHRMHTLVTGWRNIAGVEDGQVAKWIRQDGIDLLIFLAGHFDGNRTLLPIYRAAPIQISWHDCATSGFEQMDYILVDRVMVPRHTLERFSERVVCLPTVFAYAPMEDAPPVSPLPMTQTEGVMLGCFNNPAKLHAGVLQWWGRLLLRLPNARLLLKYQNAYTDPVLRHFVLDHFASLSVPAHRILFEVGHHSRRDHLAHYARVDIALDPFPYCGATTTFEALWMGVPVIAYPGHNMMSRFSASMLYALKLDQWVADSEETYLAAVEQLASNPVALADWRKHLRDRVRLAPFCDGKRKTRQLERVLRCLWRVWCKSR
ncbi:protein O-GlcNAc transferase [uncultured Gammaproteobacteria bacterium]